MEKLNVKLPAIQRALRSRCPPAKASNNDSKPKKSSRDRVRKYREKLKSDPQYQAKLQELKERKKEENKAYKDKIRALRKSDPKLDKKCKQMQNKWNKTRKERKQSKVKKNTQSEQRQTSYSTEKKTKASLRKRAQRARKSLPNEPGKWAETMSHIILNATPRRRSMLIQQSDDTDTANTLSINKRGRPSKESAEAKRKLAFSSSGTDFWKSAKSLGEYKRRKNKQQKRLTKAKQFRIIWKPKVEKFLEQNSRTMPNKKDTVKIAGKHVAKHHLLCSKRELFKKFKTAHPDFHKKYTTFNSMIPKNFKCLDVTCRRVCVCTKDYNMQQKVEALNRESLKKSMLELKTNIKQLSDITLCPYEQIPNRECVDRQCKNCGTEVINETFKPVIEASELSEQIKFHQWETAKESYVGKDGNKKISTRWVQVEKKTNVPGLVEDLAESMETFTGHLFRASYQQMMENKLSEELPIDQAMVVMDFSENIALVPQDEIESAHWTTKQVTLHPIYIVRHDSTSTPESPNLVKESLVVLSDHLGHNASSVYAFTVQLIHHLQQNPGPCPIRVIHRFTDNCSAQYKCKDAFQHIPLLEKDFGVNIVYHYTESGHGKGPSDGIGAGIKKKLDNLILGGKVINNTYEAYLALVQNPNEKLHQRIVYVPYKKIVSVSSKKLECIKSLKGTQSFHMIVKRNPNSDIVEGHDLSCTCSVCISEEEGPCYFGQFRHEPQLFHLSTGKHVTKNEMQPKPIQLARSTNSTPQPDQHVYEANTASHCEHMKQVAESMSRFESQIIKKGFKLRGNTPTDGNCFFWAISDQLDMNGNNNCSHVQLRHRVVEYMKTLPQSEKLSLEEFLTVDMNQYLENMAKNGTYADHVCVQNMCKVLDVNIRVIHGDAADIAIGSKESPALFLGYLPELEHYVSLERIVQLQPEDFVAVKLKSRKSTHLYIAKVVKIEDDEMQVKFMRATAVDGEYIWPPNEDMSWQSHDDILQKLSMPTLVHGRGLRLKFNLANIVSTNKFVMK